MRVVSINKYQVIYYDKENQLLKSEWLEETNKMPLSKFRKEAERCLNFVLKFKPTTALIDFTTFNYDFNKNDIVWFNAIHSSDIVEKVAIIMSPSNMDFAKNIEELLNNNSILNKKTQIFSTEYESMEWLGLTKV
jgi:hypothetical protein